MKNSIEKLPWLTALAVVLWYTLYGWELSVVVSPLSSWLIAAAIAAFLAAAINIALLLAIPGILAATWLVGLPLALNTALIKGTAWSRDDDRVIALVNTLGSGITFIVMTFILSAFWFSPLFWAKWQMTKKGFHRIQIFWTITFSSWVGLGLGWLIGRWQ
ncbi:hypothetical protein [Pseudanabaena sp. PCC 6802]|uniref:hypothetical protein n=1 Tax=Pseudanabaena sp. PCC 6802 TaxID=118173 RepID=UPI00034955E4|nr:hypothetical protein [Pseudanabaena sp. PCC 6802]